MWEDLAGAWTFNGDTTDASGLGNDGIATNIEFTTADGRCETDAGLFDGTSAELVLPATNEAATDKTLTARFKYEPNGTHQAIYAAWGVHPNKILFLNIDPNGYVWGSVGATNDTSASLSSNFPLQAGQIYEVVFVYTYGQEMRLYIDGELDASMATTIEINGNTPYNLPSIGSINYADIKSQYFNSWIAEVKKYDRAFTAYEIDISFQDFQEKMTGHPINWQNGLAWSVCGGFDDQCDPT